MIDDANVETPVTDNSNTAPIENVEKSNIKKYLNTIFKSSYWHGPKLCQLFINYDVGGHKSFSFISKTGPVTVIHNIAAENKLPLIRNMLSKLTPEELALVLKK